MLRMIEYSKDLARIFIAFHSNGYCKNRHRYKYSKINVPSLWMLKKKQKNRDWRNVGAKRTLIMPATDYRITFLWTYVGSLGNDGSLATCMCHIDLGARMPTYPSIESKAFSIFSSFLCNDALQFCFKNFLPIMLSLR